MYDYVQIGNGDKFMDNTQLLVMVASIAGLFFWNRGEARTDNRRALDLLDAISKEMKDFHNRLCDIEARRK